VPDRTVLRIVTSLLLVLIAVDLAAIHTCALDAHGAQGPPHATIAAPEAGGAAACQNQPLHPDHCFCHGLSVGADFAALAAPWQPSGTVPDTPSGQVRSVPSALYHPPQLPA
jgi:hypothetical protein